MKINITDWIDAESRNADCKNPHRIGNRTVATNGHILISTKLIKANFLIASSRVNKIHFDYMHNFNGKVLRDIIIQNEYFTSQHHVYEINGFQFQKKYVDLINKKGVLTFTKPFPTDDAAQLHFKHNDTWGVISGLKRSKAILCNQDS